MADKNKDDLQTELDQIKAENAKLKKDNAVLASEKVELEATLTDASIAGAPMKIAGKATVVLTDINGNEVKKTVGFKPGRRQVRLQNGAAVSSAGFLKVVNGQKLSDEEKADENLASLSQEDAKARLEYLARVGGRNLEERK